MKVLQQYRWVILPVIVAALITLPLWGSSYWVLFFMLFSLYLAMAQMWNLLVGYSGLISLGQQCFVGLGGYTLAVLSVYYGVPIWLSILMGGVISVLFALIISVPIFRMRGVYFAIGTLIVAEALALCFSNWKYVKYGMGLFVKPAYNLSLDQIYYAALAMGIGSVVLVYILLRSKLGLGLMAMRDDEGASETLGVEIFRSKLYCFLIGAFVTGVTAGVFYLYQIFIQPYKAFGIEWTIRVLFIVVIGGIGTIEGPIIGAFLFVFLQQLFAEYIHVSLLLLGSVAIIVMLVAPKGIMGTIQEKLGFEILSPRRK